MNKKSGLKKFLVLVSLFFGFNSYSQVELYNVGESGPSVFFSPISPYFINFNFVSKGKLGLGAAVNISSERNPQMGLFALSYDIANSNSSEKRFSLPLSFIFANSQDNRGYGLGLTAANKMKMNKYAYIVPSVSLVYLTTIGGTFKNNENLDIGLNITLLISRFAVSGGFVGINNLSGTNLRGPRLTFSLGFAFGNNKQKPEIE